MIIKEKVISQGIMHVSIIKRLKIKNPKKNTDNRRKKKRRLIGRKKIQHNNLKINNNAPGPSILKPNFNLPWLQLQHFCQSLLLFLEKKKKKKKYIFIHVDKINK